MDRPRVCIVPEYPLSLMTGGTIVQAVETHKALTKYVPGLRFELFNWSEVDTPADCYHFIGLPRYMAGVCSLLLQSRRPYVVTLLMGSPKPDGLRMRAARWRRQTASRLGWRREHQHAMERATTLIAITPREAEAIADVFRIPANRIQVVPVAVSEFYFESKPNLWESQYGSEPFVLCVGAIQERKNQLLLVKTCNELGLPLVLVGSVLHGQDAYADQVRVAMSKNQKVGGRWLRCDDTLLASAYAACKVFALLSVAETQPASVLQAMALQKPVLLANAPYAQAHPFEGLLQVDCRDESEVKNALQRVWAKAPPSALPHEFTWPRVCQRLASIYFSVLST